MEIKQIPQVSLHPLRSLRQGEGKVKVKAELMIKAGKCHTFFMKKLKELEERVNSYQR